MRTTDFVYNQMKIYAPAFAVQLHSNDIQIGDFGANFVIYALITSLMGIKSFDLLFTHWESVIWVPVKRLNECALLSFTHANIPDVRQFKRNRLHYHFSPFASNTLDAKCIKNNCFCGGCLIFGSIIFTFCYFILSTDALLFFKLHLRCKHVICFHYVVYQSRLLKLHFVDFLSTNWCIYGAFIGVNSQLNLFISINSLDFEHFCLDSLDLLWSFDKWQ